jgi:ABC-type ATPase involved in cell division
LLLTPSRQIILLSYLTVYDNIAFRLLLNGIKRRMIMKRVSELLEKIGLPDAGAAMPVYNRCHWLQANSQIYKETNEP